MSIVLTRASKQAARYTDAGGRERCSGCRFFMPQGTCGRIVGPVSPRGWCRFFSQEAVQRWQPQGAIGFGMGPSLALDFMNPGIMPTGITFTRASTATYFDATGTMQTAATNAPRFDYDPVTHAALGLLIEEQRTNGVPNGNAVGAVVGTPGSFPTGWVFSDNTGIMPAVVGFGTDNGIPYVDMRLVGTTTGTANNIFPANSNVPAGNSQAWVGSVYFRIVAGAAPANLLTIICSDNGGPHYAGAFTPTGASLASQRYINAFTTNSSGVTALSFFVGLTLPAATAVDFTIRIGAVQLEQGAFPTSYIPTTTAAVTRSADICAIPPANVGFFVSPGGSWQAEFIYNKPPTTYERVIWCGAINSLALIGITSTNNGFQYDNVGLVATGNSTAVGGVVKAASTWAASTGSVCLNGGAVASGGMTGGYAQVVTAGIQFMTAAGAPAAESIPGYIRRVRYWPRVLSNAEMQAVTT